MRESWEFRVLGSEGGHFKVGLAGGNCLGLNRVYDVVALQRDGGIEVRLNEQAIRLDELTVGLANSLYFQVQHFRGTSSCYCLVPVFFITVLGKSIHSIPVLCM